MAAILQALVFSGSRLDTGEPNDSGLVYAYIPGTTSPATIYSDAEGTIAITQPITLDAGGRIPYTTYPDGVWVTDPVRLFVQDVDGNTVSDAVTWTSDAGTTALGEDLADAFSGDSVEEALLALYASTGGQDGTYLESGGATPRPIQDKFREIWISVADEGAIGNGVAIDTTAIQNAINRVIALGGGVCYFPPGTYKIDQALTITSATGVRLVGAGSRASIISTTSTTANTFTLSSCTACSIELLRLQPATNSGAGIGITSSTDTLVSRVTMKAGHDYGINLTSSNLYAVYCTLDGALRDVKFSGNGVTQSTIRDTVFSLSDAAVEISAFTKNVGIHNCYYLTTIGVLFTTGLTGTGHIISDSPTLSACTTPLSIGTSTLPNYRQWGNGIDAFSTSGAIGTTLTPTLYQGQEIHLNATSGAPGTVTLGAPAILPGTSTRDVNLYWDFFFKNAAGGAVTWDYTTAAVYRTTAIIPTTNLHTIVIRFQWDKDTGLFREVFRGDTLT